jgi:protein-tyrosine-phosphatase
MEASDLVLVMTRNHAEALRVAFPEQAHKVHMLSTMVGRTYDIADPYGASRMAYVTVAKELEELIGAGYARIIALAEENSSG